jgi:hypothetical protein
MKKTNNFGVALVLAIYTLYIMFICKVLNDAKKKLEVTTWKISKH